MIPKPNGSGSSVGGSTGAANDKTIVEVFPVKKMAKIKGSLLILSGLDGSHEACIELKKCNVHAVSSSGRASRKWAKRYPIKVESTEVIHKGSTTCYVFLETSWDKESWCKALRLASSPNTDEWTKYATLIKDFRCYISSLNAKYCGFFKPSGISAEVVDRSSRQDGGLSKARNFFKRFSRKGYSKPIEEGKLRLGSSLHSDRRSLGKLKPDPGVLSAADSLSSHEGKSFNSLQQDLLSPTPPDESGSSNVHSHDILNESTASNEGTLCWNLLVSRLFFDVKKSTEIFNSIQMHIKRAMSNMRTPSYIGDLILADFSLGELPPYLQKMRVLPGDLNELWAFEVDFEYSGGIYLNIETRLEVHAPEFEKDIMKADSEGSRDLTEGSEQCRNQNSSSSEITVESDRKDEAGVKNTKSTGWTSAYKAGLKSMLNSIADSVSQVPLSFTIKITSIRGTMRFHMKPPPTNQLWYGFSSMPQIEWDLEASIGDRRIKNSHIASLVGNRIMGALRETLVLPNCEFIGISFMVAEKEDWLPRTAAPYIFKNHDGANSPPSSPDETRSRSHHGSAERRDFFPDQVQGTSMRGQVLLEEPRDATEPPRLNSLSGSSTQPSYAGRNNDLRIRLLSTSGAVDSVADNREITPLSRPPALAEPGQYTPTLRDNRTQKKTSRHARMMDFGKMVGDKLAERTRDIREKGRGIVERMGMRGQEIAFESREQATGEQQ